MTLSRSARECQAAPRVEIRLPEDFRSRFSTLFAYGIRIEAPSGVTVQDLFSGWLKMDPDYLEEHVQTILHEGKPVDNIATYRLYASSSIALSAALPGLFGAAFRKGGALSPLRLKAESPATAGSGGQPIEITIKLFNMVAKTLGPELLQRGIRIATADFLKFLEMHSDLESVEPMTLQVDGRPTTAEALTAWLASGPAEMVLVVRRN